MQTPDPRNPTSMHDCVEKRGADSMADGIVLDAERHHVQLAIVAFPDSRLYLMEVFLVPRWPHPDLHTAARYTLPRIVVRFPVMRTSWYPKMFEAFRRGIEAAGARPVTIAP